MKYQAGLVIGKFYPPHLGHSLLIQAALDQCRSVDIVICDHHHQKINGNKRAAWLKSSFPQAKVHIVADAIDENNSKLWADLVRTKFNLQPDAVFTSEAYGDSFANELGSKHICVDRQRQHIPISATMIREDLSSYWNYLLPSAKQDLSFKICALGAESTGTTTLARQLAAHYQTVWVPEFGRYYWEGRQFSPSPDKWTSKEFLTIATNQNDWETAFSHRINNQLLIYDTDSFATTVWHNHFMGEYSAELSTIRSNNYADLYILTSPDFKTVQDGTRENNEQRRHQMHREFIKELNRMKLPYIIVRGDKSARIKQACSAIDQLTKEQKLLF